MQVPSFVLTHTDIKDSKMWHFYLLLTGWSAIFTMMSTSIVLFLSESFGSLVWAGVCLAVGNILSIFFDGFFSYIQKVYQARTLFLSAILGMIVSVSLFLLSFNPIITILASIIFSIIYDLCDITAMSYIFAKCLPAQYGTHLSYRQLSQGIGMIIGFLFSAVLVQASYLVGVGTAKVLDTSANIVGIQSHLEQFISSLFIVKILLLLLLLGLLFFAYLMFDKDIEDISKKFLATSFQKLESDTMQGLKSGATKIFHNISNSLITKEKNQIELQSTETTKVSFSFQEMFQGTIDSLKDILLVFSTEPKNIPLLWSMGILVFFSYWDTFLVTFMPIFFNQVMYAQAGWLREIPGNLVLLMFILPILVLLPLSAKLGDRLGRMKFIVFGVVLTTIACLLIATNSLQTFWVIVIAGFCISFGYLFGINNVRADLAEKMNTFLAVEKKASEIDTNASAGPITVINNVGNIIGPILGGVLVASIQFQGFFLCVGIMLLSILVITIRYYVRIKTPAYIFNSPMKTENQTSSAVENNSPSQ